MPVRLPTWFRYDHETGARLQRRDDTHIPVGRPGAGKFVLHEHTAKSGIAMRGGLARCVAWAWAFKSFGIRDWLRFIEAYGHPLRVGKYHKGATDPERDVLLRAVASIASDFSGSCPKAWRSSSSSPRAPASARISTSILDAAISKAVLGQTLTTQEGNSGSYSLGQVAGGRRMALRQDRLDPDRRSWSGGRDYATLGRLWRFSRHHETKPPPASFLQDRRGHQPQNLD